MALILLVEDDALLGRTVGSYLEKAGHTIFWARNRDETFEALGAQAVQLVFLDIMLPGVDGLAILQEIRRKWNKETLPVIMMTNLSDMEVIERATAMGANDYIVKANIDMADLAHMLQSKYSLS